MQTLKKLSFVTLKLWKTEYGLSPTSTYQEISLSNGWEKEFLSLAKKSDKQYERIKGQKTTDNKKEWWRI